MPALAIKQTTFDGLSEQKQSLIRFVLKNLRLGVPALYKQGASTFWYVFDDSRISLKDFAYLGRLGANIGAFPLGEIDAEGWTDRQTRGFIMGWLSRDGITFDGTPEAPNPWQDILDLNGAPAAIKGAASVPPTWVKWPPPPPPEEPE